jgi:acetyl-CoA synthetase
MNYTIENLEQYFRQYRRSVRVPRKFWGEIASNFEWYNKWETVLDHDMTEARFTWFEGGKLNITQNAIDRHLETRANKTAILFEPNDPAEAAQKITYRELHERVCRMANVLLDQGIRKGDRVCIYLPMIPELAVSVLACARIGAVHSIVFGAFSPDSLKDRINDSKAKILVTQDTALRGGKNDIPMKTNADTAVKQTSSIEKVIVVIIFFFCEIIIGYRLPKNRIVLYIRIVDNWR